MALRFDRTEEQQVATALAENGVPIRGIHTL
jgi:hypothetical protein